jgi:nicotinate phosphoribosyltransferase
MANNEELLTDLYQLTMAQGYWECGKLDEQACFYLHFRKNPFNGGYVVACGLDQVAELVEDFAFDEADIAYLAGIEAPGGGKLFKPGFLEYLRTMELSVDIDAVHEGDIVFPFEPVLRVCGPILQCQIIETPILTHVGFQSLIATKAARICEAAVTPVAEFGLRRAQGPAGGIYASRAAVVGGCASTSNVLAGQRFGVPVSGTHAHSWVMSFEDELTAFRAYAQAMPKNCVLLVDTYDVEQGIDNAITVGLEMKERGERLMGIRIDSGDLAWLAKIARKKLDDAGLTDTGIVLSNDLDEQTILSIREQGAQVNSWGVGTKLASSYDQPTLGCVYKLSAVKHAGSDVWEDCLKISGQLNKLTTPGIQGIRRYYHDNGRVAGDMVYDVNAEVNEREVIIDPADVLRQKKLSGKRFKEMLHPLSRDGKVVLQPEFRDPMAAQARVKAGLAELDESQKRMLNPHSYPVGLEANLFKRRASLVKKLRHYE